MNKETKLSQSIANFIHAINDHNPAAFLSAFAEDAVVNDVGREFRGTAAIREWGEREIFSVHVTLDVIKVEDRDGHTVVTVKPHGAFDRTGLPDPLLLDQRFTMSGGKIAALSIRLAGAAS